MLAWIDLEMTGLDPTTDVIVEIASLITDDDLELIAEGPDLVVHQPAEALSRMGDYVREMHTRSGLLDAVTASSTTLEEAGATTLAFLRGHISEPATVPLCGNSIGTDRRFLAAWLPEIDRRLDHQGTRPQVAARARRLRPDQGRWTPGTRRHPRIAYRVAPLPQGPLPRRRSPRHLSHFIHLTVTTRWC